MTAEDRYFDAIDTMTEQAFHTGGPSLNPLVPSRAEMSQLDQQAWRDTPGTDTASARRRKRSV